MNPSEFNGVSYATAMTTNNASFNLPAGSHTVYGRVYDKDNAYREYSSLLVVAPRNLSVIAVAQSKEVGDADPALTYQVTGLQYNDTSLEALSGALTRIPGESPGVYDILQGTLLANPNYVLSYFANTFTIHAPSINHPPLVTLGTPVDGFMGEAAVFSLSALDPDAADQNGSFTYQIAWGNGQVTTVTGPSTRTVSYTYPNVAADGKFTITVTATDARGAISNAVTASFIVGGWTLMADPLYPGKSALVVVGSQSADNIRVKLKDDDYYRVRIKSADDEVRRRGNVFGDVQRILLYGFNGDDKITIEDDIVEPVEVWGGSGDDSIKGGSGNDIILGQSGDDNLWGGNGRDIVIGGLGADKIHGDAQDDILIAGFTIYESDFALGAPAAFGATASATHLQNRQALAAIMAEWASNRTYSQRRLNILGIGSTNRNNGNYFLKTSNQSMTQNTVFDDAAVDKIWGDSGTDWFFANNISDQGNVKDELKDRSGNEFIEDLDKWW